MHLEPWLGEGRHRRIPYSYDCVLFIFRAHAVTLRSVLEPRTSNALADVAILGGCSVRLLVTTSTNYLSLGDSPGTLTGTFGTIFVHYFSTSLGSADFDNAHTWSLMVLINLKIQKPVRLECLTDMHMTSISLLQISRAKELPKMRT